MLIDPVRTLDGLVSASMTPEPTFGASLPPGDDSDDGSGENHCSRVLQMMDDYTDELLSKADSAAVNEHLFECTNCRVAYNAAVKVEEILSREWHKSVPLPSSSHTRQAIDRIMDSIPGSKPSGSFPEKRVHSRTRWMRFPESWNPLESGS